MITSSYMNMPRETSCPGLFFSSVNMGLLGVPCCGFHSKVLTLSCQGDDDDKWSLQQARRHNICFQSNFYPRESDWLIMFVAFTQTETWLQNYLLSFGQRDENWWPNIASLNSSHLHCLCCFLRSDQTNLCWVSNTREAKTCLMLSLHPSILDPVV